MIEFSRSTDYELIRSIITHPKLWPHLSDDGSPPREEYRPIESDAIWYVVVRDCDEVLGLWMLHEQSHACWEIHTALLPQAWGARAIQAALELPKWIWANTYCQRIITTVPTCNRLALRFAVRAGMKIYGVNESSFLKNGRLCDQVCLGMSKPHAAPIPEAETPLESFGVYAE